MLLMGAMLKLILRFFFSSGKISSNLQAMKFFMEKRNIEKCGPFFGRCIVEKDFVYFFTNEY